MPARNKYKNQADRFKADLASREQELAQLRQRLESAARMPAPAPVAQPAKAAPPQGSEATWLDDILGVSENAEADAAQNATPDMQKMFEERLQAQAQQFEARMHEYEVGQAQQSLEKEIAGVVGRYPSLRAQDLAQLVINDPSVNLMEAAETFMTYKASLEEEAIAKYLRDNPHLTQQEKQAVVEAAVEAAAETAPPSAPPRPQGSRASAAEGSQASSTKPSSLKDVRRALHEHFKQSNPFAR